METRDSGFGPDTVGRWRVGPVSTGTMPAPAWLLAAGWVVKTWR
jgi:hypothetical protein